MARAQGEMYEGELANILWRFNDELEITGIVGNMTNYAVLLEVRWK